MLTKLLIVFLAGGAGCVFRYLVGEGAKRWTHDAEGVPKQDAVLGLVPVGTLAVNIVGCLLIGIVLAVLPSDREEERLAVVVGLLGGFTTFSAFGHETLRLMQDGRVPLALAYVGASVVLGLAAAAGGHALGTRFAT